MSKEIENMIVNIRSATPDDIDAIWGMIEPVFRAGETYCVPCNIERSAALDYWCAPENHVFIAEVEGQIVGTYFLHANQRGGGAHVANCGYVTSTRATGRGIARAMCLHSKEQAKRCGFRAIQFNFVVSTNERAVKLWQGLGFEIVGTLPLAFKHPVKGYTDAFVMFAAL
jgi:ribosomal protein S18 acetylase RimI-like enzyme